MFSNIFSENCAVWEKMSKNMVNTEGPQATWRMRVACRVVRLHARKHTPVPMHLHHTHAHTQAYR